MNNMEKEIFIMPDGTKIKEFTLRNKHGIIIKILNFGGIITSLMIPDKNGITDDIVLGYDHFEPYIMNPPYFGSIIGRVANRICNSSFTIDGETFNINSSFKGYALHGGIEGFDKKVWESKLYKIDGEQGVELNYFSPDGEEGFPGNLNVRVIYRLNDNNEFFTEYFATTDKATHVNLTNHSYFNFSGKNTIHDHELLILSDRIIETDNNYLPTGKYINIKGSPFDFIKMHAIGDRIDETDVGYDHTYVFNKPDNELSPAAKIYDPNSERVMEVFTTYPSMQLYTANYIEDIKGKDGKTYKNHEALCLETQMLPDAANHSEFPTSLLSPDDFYSHVTVLRFGIAK